MADLQLKEAEWVGEELLDRVRLIQRYRSTYVAAVFASIGWLLTQALSVPNRAPSAPSAIVAATSAAAASSTIVPLSAPPTGGPSLAELRNRADIATILCLIPILNCFFFVLVLEVQYRMESLARYRYILGYELGNGSPVWRWEIWKTTPEGTFQPWTIPSNVVFFVVAFVVPCGALSFALPAVWYQPGLILKAS